MLINKTLVYYKDKNQLKIKGIFNFDQVTFNVSLRPVEDPNEMILSTLISNLHFHIKSNNISQWAKAIYCHLIISEGYKHDFTPIIKNFNLAKNSLISEHEFRNQVQTGDIILFKGKNILCQFQQFFSNCKYDHVAMALKYKSGKIGFLEATLQNGVCVTY